MEEFIEKLAAALKAEYSFLGAEAESWRMAARGIVEKMGLESEDGPAMTLYFFSADAEMV